METFEKAVGELRVKDIVVGSIITGFGFLVALTWRDAINATLDQIVPDGSGLLYPYLAAVIVTIIAVIVGYVLVRIQRANIAKLASMTIIHIPRHGRKNKKLQNISEKPVSKQAEKPTSKNIEKKIVRVEQQTKKIK